VIDLFDRTVGLKPKSYQRVRRLRRVFHLVHESPRPTWTSIAHRCGYFDQAHLINDFRLLTGISPREYERTHSSVGYGFVPAAAARISNRA
jgi:AraC-like DNA-binding protein